MPILGDRERLFWQSGSSETAAAGLKLCFFDQNFQQGLKLSWPGAVSTDRLFRLGRNEPVISLQCHPLAI